MTSFPFLCTLYSILPPCLSPHHRKPFIYIHGGKRWLLKWYLYWTHPSLSVVYIFISFYFFYTKSHCSWNTDSENKSYKNKKINFAIRWTVICNDTLHEAHLMHISQYDDVCIYNQTHTARYIRRTLHRVLWMDIFYYCSTLNYSLVTDM